MIAKVEGIVLEKRELNFTRDKGEVKQYSLRLYQPGELQLIEVIGSEELKELGEGEKIAVTGKVFAKEFAGRISLSLRAKEIQVQDGANSCFII